MSPTTATSCPRPTVRELIAAKDRDFMASARRTVQAIRDDLERLAQLEPGHADLEEHDPAEIRAALESCYGAPAAERPAAGSNAAQHALRHLKLIGKDPAKTWFRSLKPTGGANHRRRGADLHGFNEAELRADAADNAALYAVIGNASSATGKKGGVQNSDVESLPALFVEWDDLPLHDQLMAWQRLGLPEPTLMLTTGGASAHVYWRMRQPAPKAEWDAITERLIAHCKSDPACKGAARVMRLAGSRYIDKGTGKPTGTRAEIVHEAPEAIYTLAQIAACLPEPPAPAAAAHTPAPAAGRRVAVGAAVALEQLLPRDLEALAIEGVPERGGADGGRSNSAFRLAAVALAVADAAVAAGLSVDGTPEAVVLQFAARCSPPLPEHEALACLRSAESSPRTTDPGWPDRLRYHLNRQAREQRQQLPSAAAPAAPQLAAPAPVGEDAGLVLDAEPAGQKPIGTKAGKVRPGELLSGVLWAMGQPRLNIRTRQVHVGGGAVIGAPEVLSSDDVARLYLRLSSAEHGALSWAKEPTFDAVMALASAAAFDPLQGEILSIAESTEPLPMGDWERLDLLLFNHPDPIARDFMPRYLVSAVARLLEPGCKADQLPVLVGKQGIGKSELGKTLFGKPWWIDNLGHRLEVDDVTRCHRAWGCELAELDGLTRKADVESLKAFLSRQTDVVRRPYGRSEAVLERGFAFWGTSNSPPLRDMTGNRRFVCIALPAKPLPLLAVAEMREAIWSRAVQQYRAGFQWWSTPAEAAAIADRNADHLQADPWHEVVAGWLKGPQARAGKHVSLSQLHSAVEVPPDRQNNATATRLRQIAESLGWSYCRRRLESGERLRAFWPPEVS